MDEDYPTSWHLTWYLDWIEEQGFDQREKCEIAAINLIDVFNDPQNRSPSKTRIKIKEDYYLFNVVGHPWNPIPTNILGIYPVGINKWRTLEGHIALHGTKWRAWSNDDGTLQKIDGEYEYAMDAVEIILALRRF